TSPRALRSSLRQLCHVPGACFDVKAVVSGARACPWLVTGRLTPTRHGRNSAVIPAAFYRLDGDQRVGTAACCVLTEFRLIRSSTVRKVMRLRSITTLCLFGVALVVALKYPLTAIGICICCLIAYLKPDPPVVGKPISSE